MPVVARAKTARITEENFMVRYEFIGCNEEGLRWKRGWDIRIIISNLSYQLHSCLKKPRFAFLVLSEKLGPNELRRNAMRNVVTPFTYHELEGAAYPRQFRFLHVL
jgi:hypothetical protein